jgi:ADP-dependent NAD(P)H-hydrate dehydratase
MRSICWRVAAGAAQWQRADPAPGEAARLLGISTEAVQADRPGAARKLARKYASVCVLKAPARWWLTRRAAGAVRSRSSGHGRRRAGRCAHRGAGALLAQGWTPGGGLPGVWLHARAGERWG